MNSEFFEALLLLEKEKGIPAKDLLEKIHNAISTAVKHNYGITDEQYYAIDINLEKKRFYVAIRKNVVEDITNPTIEILIDEARKYDKNAVVGSIVEISLETKEFGRIAAQTAKQVIKQGIREVERSQLLVEYQSKLQDIVSAVILKQDLKKGGITLEIGRSEAILPKAEQVPSEQFKVGERIKVFVVDVVNGDKGPRIMISRTHPGLVKRLFEMQVPEIYEGVVEIKSISREAGSRTKIAVWSKDDNVDAVGSCIGPKGARIADIVEELGGEKIDVIKYSLDPCEFIAASLSPADVLSVSIECLESKTCRVVVPNNQLSLAIGNKGQNARLAAKLTGWKIDIRPEEGELLAKKIV